ncbi:MAG: lysine biosynthesis protein LysX [candidate division KSB1 bacterium]|nr:lysine biosynthesis protein LysX [candidate division KSB1 bacterium]
MKVGVLCSIVRKEEKLIFQEMRRRGIEFDVLDVRNLTLDISQNGCPYSIILERCVEFFRALYSLKIYNDHGIKTVNSYEVSNICGNKLLTTSTLVKNGLPLPRTKIAYSYDSALQAIEELGYPVVLKPIIGSWGRLLSKINDREAAEAVLEHKVTLGNSYHSIFYIQEYINKPLRDIRVIVIGEEAVAAIYRNSEHWITNMARNGQAQNCPLTPELEELSIAAAKAVGGGILAIDLLEDDGRLLISEVNHTMEFKQCMEASNINIPAKIVDYLLEQLPC